MEKKKNKFLYFIILLSFGLILTFIGLLMLLFEKPSIYNLIGGRYPNQLVVENGLLELITGLGFILGSILTFRSKNKKMQKHKWEKRDNWLKYN